MAKKSGGGIFKRLLGNKNTVTLLGIASSVAILIVGYNLRVNSQTSNLVVPYAKQTIPAKTMITNEMIGSIRIPSQYASAAGGAFIQNQKQVVTNYSTYKSDIPAGSLFYKLMVKTKAEMPDAAFRDIPDGYTLYSLAVGIESTFGNSMRAGDYIDLWVSTIYEDKPVYTKMISSIRIDAVKDTRGQNIIRNSLEYGKPSEMLFSVPDEIYLYLKWAEYLGDFEVVPVKYNTQYTLDKGELKTHDFIIGLIDEKVNYYNTAS